jgi:hypothetical protein
MFKRHHFEVLCFLHNPEDRSADPAEAVDADSNCRGFSALLETNKGNQSVFTLFKSSKACLSLSVMDTSPCRSHTLGS